MTSLQNLLILFFICFICQLAGAQDNPVQPGSEIEQLKAELQAIRTDYESRIRQLELKLEQLQSQSASDEYAATEPAEIPVAEAPTVQSSPALLNPAISVIGNFVGRGDADDVFNEEGDRISNKLNLRETEIDMRAAVDPYADAVVIAAFESEFPGEFEVGIEEGYVNLKRIPFVEQMPLGLRLKVGRFRPSFGKINILHTHDLPTTFRALPVEEFLGEEGFVQNGVSGNFFLPTPWDADASLDATVEIFDGGNVGFSPQSEAPISYLGHLRYFKTVSDAHNVELGWTSYFHPEGDVVGSANAHGIDFLYKWKPLRMGEWKSFILGAEYMFVPETTANDVSAEKILDVVGGTPAGFTLFGQWQFDRRTYAGIRFDQTDTLLDPDLQRSSITPYVSYYFSEFLRFRVNYEHRWSDLEEEDGRNALLFELNWIIGAHPPEPFWVNR